MNENEAEYATGRDRRAIQDEGETRGLAQDAFKRAY